MAGGEAGVTNTGMFWEMTIKLPPKALLFKHKTRSFRGPVYKTDKQTSPRSFSKVMFQL